MPADFHDSENVLSALEQRLTGWRPEADGLDSDAMLFAAGFAMGRRVRRRSLSLALYGLLLALSAGLGVWGWSERAEHQALRDLLRQTASVHSASPETNLAVAPESVYQPSSDDYLNMRRRMEQDPNAFLSSLQPAPFKALGPPPPQPAILTPRSRDGSPLL